MRGEERSGVEWIVKEKEERIERKWDKIDLCVRQPWEG